MSLIREKLKKVTGGEQWTGKLFFPSQPSYSYSKLQIRYTSVKDKVMRRAFVRDSVLAIRVGKDEDIKLTFLANKPATIVVNNLPTGGERRFRHWLTTCTIPSGEDRKFLYFSADDVEKAELAAKETNAVYGDGLPVMYTSAMPEVRVIVGSKVMSRSRVGTLTHYSVSQNKQVSEPMAFTVLDPKEPVRVWIGKRGSELSGFAESTTLSDLTSSWSSGGNLRMLLQGLELKKLYLLSPKQQKELLAAQSEAKEEGLWDAAEDDFEDSDEGRQTYQAIQALKSWKPLEDVAATAVTRTDIQEVLEGKRFWQIKESFDLIHMCKALAEKPRFELKGTTFDKVIEPYMDVVGGEIKLMEPHSLGTTLVNLIQGLSFLGTRLKVNPDDSDERKELISTLRLLRDAGTMNYNEVLNDLKKKFPLLGVVSRFSTISDEAMDDLCHALAAVYK